MLFAGKYFIFNTASSIFEGDAEVINKYLWATIVFYIINFFVTRVIVRIFYLINTLKRIKKRNLSTVLIPSKLNKLEINANF